METHSERRPVSINDVVPQDSSRVARRVYYRLEMDIWTVDFAILTETCKSHYHALEDAMTTKGNGKTIQWIRDHQAYEHDEWCLMWPFSRTRGYGTFGYLGKGYYAHRFMCELVHGPAPTPLHQAAHSCGSGHLGCVNPLHLSWKTQSENQLDCREHGTSAKTDTGNKGRLSLALADEIRALKGVKTQWQIAEQYRISESTVSDIWLGRTWARPSKIPHYTPEDDQKIRGAIAEGCNFTQIGKMLGRPAHAVSSRAYRLGLKSGQPVRKIMP